RHTRFSRDWSSDVCSSDLDEIRPVPSMFLGAFSLTPIEVAQMYQTVTNSGRKAPLTALRSVVDLDGNVLYQSLPKSSLAVDEQEIGRASCRERGDVGVVGA